jgi:hypothetical protein
MKMFQLTNRDIEDLAAISKRPISQITSKLVACVLQTEGCVERWKELMGMDSMWF